MNSLTSRYCPPLPPPPRLTLVKGWNMAEVEQYAALLDLGLPHFIEIKVCVCVWWGGGAGFYGFNQQ